MAVVGARDREIELYAATRRRVRGGRTSSALYEGKGAPLITRVAWRIKGGRAAPGRRRRRSARENWRQERDALERQLSALMRATDLRVAASARWTVRRR